MADYGAQSTESKEEDYEYYEFVSDIPDALNCQICLSVVEQPLQHVTCGKLFCKVCLDEQPFRQCPNCRTTDQRYFEDTRGDREAQNLIIRCDCSWKGEWRLLEQHRNINCLNTMVPCPNSCVDKITGRIYKCQRRYLQIHSQLQCPKRQFQCPHCKEMGTYKERTTTHLKVCPMVPTKCPNEGCIKMLPAWRINSHSLNECGFTILECTYKKIGCNARIKRINLEEHENNTGVHFQSVVSLVTSQHEQLARQQEQLAMQQEQLARQQEQLARQQEQLAMTQEKLSWTEYKLLMLQNRSQNGGHMIFKLAEYTRRKQNKEKYLYSPHFYSSFYGYHFKLQACFVDDMYLSAYAVIVEGDNDCNLKWPFQGSVTIELLNQLVDGNHYSKNADFRLHENAVVGSYWGYTEFIPYSQLSCHSPVTNTQYLKDDTLYFRVQVQMSQNKPWLECGVID